MVWPCKQNASEKASQTSLISQWDNYEHAGKTALRILDGTAWDLTKLNVGGSGGS